MICSLPSFAPNVSQLIVSMVRKGKIQAELSLLQKNGDNWEISGEKINTAIGKNGYASGLGLISPDFLPKKKEGDHKSPIGVFAISSAFGYTDNPDCRWNYFKIKEGFEAVDDPYSSYYNQVVDTQVKAHLRDWHTSEKMLREDDLYKLGLIILHNNPAPLVNRGSCIFMHIWRNDFTGTEGCTAMQENDMLSIIKWLNPTSNPLFIQGERRWVEAILGFKI